MAVLAARVVGLDVAGVDLVTQDISRPLAEQRGAVIEVNAGPGLLAHLKPASGSPQPVGTAIIDHLFSAQDSGRIPIVGITGSRETTEVACLVAWLLQIGGRHVGLACRRGLFLDRRQVDASDSATWEAGQRLLINRSVEAAVFENPAQMILSEGLAYDKCAVGVVTDLDQPQALAEFFISDSDGLANVLRTQIDVVLPTGIAVLNGGIDAVASMAELCDGGVILYAADGSLATMQSHRAKEQRVVFFDGTNVVLGEGPVDVASLPLTPAEIARIGQPETILAAVAAAWALGVGPDLISAGLTTFEARSRTTDY